MDRFFKITSAVAIVLGTLGSVQAHDGRSGGSGHSGRNRDFHHSSDSHNRDSDRTHDFLSRYATSFSGGYFYKGRDHDHWTERRWFDRYGCYGYYCPYTYCYYYWCERDNCYYPVSYRPYADRDQKSNDRNQKPGNDDQKPDNGNEKPGNDNRNDDNGGQSSTDPDN